MIRLNIREVLRVRHWLIELCCFRSSTVCSFDTKSVLLDCFDTSLCPALTTTGGMMFWKYMGYKLLTWWGWSHPSPAEAGVLNLLAFGVVHPPNKNRIIFWCAPRIRIPRSGFTLAQGSKRRDDEPCAWGRNLPLCRFKCTGNNNCFDWVPLIGTRCTTQQWNICTEAHFALTHLTNQSRSIRPQLNRGGITAGSWFDWATHDLFCWCQQRRHTVTATTFCCWRSALDVTTLILIRIQPGCVGTSWYGQFFAVFDSSPSVCVMGWSWLLLVMTKQN